MSGALAALIGAAIGAVAGIVGGGFAALAAIRASQVAARGALAPKLHAMADARSSLWSSSFFRRSEDRPKASD